MIKFLLGLFLSTTLQADTLCEVYGISDSPQTLNCTFGTKKVQLSCREGVYFLNETRVEAAFHYEVEDGPVPLVFKTTMSELIVSLGQGKRHKASLQTQNQKSRGRCLK